MSNNRCPKCNEKLSPFYMKQECPKCKTNLLYYNLDSRLEADHEKAMKEQAVVDRILNNIKTSAFGGPLQIIRFVLMFSPLLWMCLPMFKASNGASITLINLIMGIINGSLPFDKILGDKTYLFPVVTMVCIIVFSLAVIISSLFSVGKKACLRNVIFSLVNLIMLLVCIALSVTSGASVNIGTVIVITVYIIELLIHKAVDKKINVTD